ncbi:MAG: HAD family hydrolase [Gammaproteobacteria bacterium]|nr:HAD family hydrolase [Gammaproteobacteria bacterium]
MAELKLITFDLDNTLWNVETVIRNAEIRMQGWLHSRVPEFPLRFPQEAVQELRNAVLEESPSLRHDLSTLREEILYRAIAECGFSRQDARRLARGAFDIFLDARHEVEFFDGALDTLERLSGAYVLGALTNGNADITRLELDRFFHFGYSSASVGASKPAPEIFLAALTHAGTPAAAAVHVGDHLHDDVGGAAGVGMHTIWVNPQGETQPDDTVRPTHTVSLIDEVPEGIRHIEQALAKGIADG